ncbi:2-keto-3-deoxygluconate permease [Jeotgalibaca porci]|uniref:2-keto-3-deoxygluconate permease n=1 Tax=Jeotgalibaca porci TaxID=1868793 RepID=UPI00359FECEC
MFDKISKLPAGLFLVPLLLSALLYTIWPEMVHIGGLTEALFSGDYMNFILGALCFYSGTGIDLKKLVNILKRQGVLLVVKLIISVALGFVLIKALGTDGLFGLSTMAMVVGIASLNPAVYLSLVNEYGKKEDAAAMGLIGLFSIPVVPMLTYSLASAAGAELDWMPVLSSLIPIAVGMLLGNLDKKFATLFAPGVSVLLPILGWNIGQGINLLEVAKAGILGLLLVVIYYIAMLPIYFVDKRILKQDGIAAVGMLSVAGVSVSTPAALAAAFPVLQPYVANAMGQILMAVVVTSVVTSFIVKKIYTSTYKK